MARGKYAQRADARLRVLESEAVRQANVKIAELTKELAAAKHDNDTLRAETHSQALAAAAGMSAREKQHLRDQLASAQHQHTEARHRDALLVWEIVHRVSLGRPAPLKMPPRSDDKEQVASYELWLKMHWEIAALFCTDWDSILRFFQQVEGYEWRLSGQRISAPGPGESIEQTSREATRILTKGAIKTEMMRRVTDMRAYYERIIKAREAGQVEPILLFRDAHLRGEAARDRRDRLIGKLKNHT